MRKFPLPIFVSALAVALAAGATNVHATGSSSDATGPSLPSFEEPEDGLFGNELTATSRNLRIVGSTLRPRTSTDLHTASSSGGCIYNSGGSASGVFNTPVYLPQGARVDVLRMYYNDTSASNSTGWFTIYDLYGTVVTEFPVSSTGNFGNSFNDSAAIDHVVDYNLYSYLLNWRPNVAGAQMQLCGFRIFYTY
ncbi:MAG TPA: hypothetical protein PKZ76_01735 [Xanthomonadaceae bacterium]|nr:hypothetical protein [Xanthomonadaceae bacterium]